MGNRNDPIRLVSTEVPILKEYMYIQQYVCALTCRFTMPSYVTGLYDLKICMMANLAVHLPRVVMFLGVVGSNVSITAIQPMVPQLPIPSLQFRAHVWF